MKKILVILCCSILSGCQTPFLVFPGGSIGDIVSHTDNFAFAKQHKLMWLEVRPEAPYSVILRCTVFDGDIYVDAARARKWGTLIKENPRVRVKLGTEIFQATAQEVEGKEVTDKFLKGRVVYRLKPNWPSKHPEK
jgi:hypothetical protein